MEYESDVLTHATRRMIWNYILSDPGLTLDSLIKALDLNRSTLRYHLNYLIRSDMVKAKKVNGKRCYFANGETPDVIDSVDLNSLSKHQRKVLTIIKQEAGVSKKAIARKTGININTVTYSINKLIELDLVWKVRYQGKVGYEFRSKEKVRSEAFLILLDMFLSDEIDKDEFLRLKKELEERTV